MTLALPILEDTDPLLRERSAEVVEFGAETEALINTMLASMCIRGGIGLAAIQIGVPLRVVIALVDGVPHALVNPVITRRLNRETIEREGCLSVPPSKWGNVSRPAKCDIRWRDASGTHCAGSFSGKLARVLQHEIDHLDGVLITDKMIA